ncbi:MAG: hypothetical protein Q9172_005744 [Xanthocarpia lactea]
MQNSFFGAAREEELPRTNTLILGSSVFGVGTDDRTEGPPFGNSSTGRRPLFYGSPEALIPTTQSPDEDPEDRILRLTRERHAELLRIQTLVTREEQLLTTLSPESPAEERFALEERLQSLRERLAENLRNQISDSPEDDPDAQMELQEMLQTIEDRRQWFAGVREAERLRNPIFGSPEEELPTTPSPESPLFGEEQRPEFALEERLHSARERYAEYLRNRILTSPEDESDARVELQEMLQLMEDRRQWFAGVREAERLPNQTSGTSEEQFPTTSSPETSLFPPFTPLQVEELLATPSPENPLSGNGPEDRRSLFAPPTARQVLRVHEERQDEWLANEWLRTDEWLRNQMSGSLEEGSNAHNPRQDSPQPNFRSFSFHDTELPSVRSVSDTEEPVLGVRRGPYMLRVRSGRVARLGTVTNARRTRFGRGVDSDDEMAD